MLRRLARGWLRRLGVDADALERRHAAQAATAVPDRAAARAMPADRIAAASASASAHVPSIPDAHLYAPLFSPWRGLGDFGAYHELASPHTLVSPDRCHVLLTLARQALRLDGTVVECGVFRGGTAMLLAKAIADAGSAARLSLFDTFEGMPATDPARDLHRAGDFADTSLESVRARVLSVPGVVRERVDFHPGWIPATFAGAALDRIALAHIDVDIHRSVLDCCEYLYPRVVDGGFMVFDDYGFPTCPGARAAVDEFFRDKPERPLVLPTGQAIVFRYRVAA